MNREEALRVLTQIAPSIGSDTEGHLRAIVRQAAELIASEVMRTSEGPLKNSPFDCPPKAKMNGVDHDAQS